MKLYSKILFLILTFSAVTFSGCEKIIVVDLNSKEPQIVIEGKLTDQSEPFEVRITKTVNFDEFNIFPPVSGATVKLRDNTGIEMALSETSPGIYKTNTMKGVSGRTYYLSVVSEGTTYSAESTMPQPVIPDTVILREIQFIGSVYKVVTLTFQDPKGIENYYRFIEHINGMKMSSIFIENDKNSDGLVVSYTLFDFNTELKKDDRLDIDLLCIDKASYLYFYSLNQASSGMTTPANPVSNFSNGALGYFSAYSVRTKTLIIP